MSSAQLVNQAPADTSTSGLLSLVVSVDGAVVSAGGRWAGVGRPSVASLFDFVHPDDHEAVTHAIDWCTEHGLVTNGLPVDVRGPSGWASAIVAFDVAPDGIACTFVPVTADPLVGVAADVSEDRRIDFIVDRVVRTFTATCPSIWISVHSGIGPDRRRRRVTAAFGHEGFGSAVATAVAGPQAAPWDTPIAEDPHPVAMDTMPDGVRLAAQHIGVTSCVAIPVPSLAGDDAAVALTWCDNVNRLSDPATTVALDRLTHALRLAFTVESLRTTIRHVATHDDLTGLWNRSAVHARLERLENVATSAVARLDIVDFASVNERHGDHAGDAVLVELARRLRDVIRPDDLLARFDGDDFVLLCSSVSSDGEAAGIAERIMSVTYQAFHVDGVPTEVRASLGVAIGRPGMTGRDLLDGAARTLAEVKRQAPGTWRIG